MSLIKHVHFIMGLDIFHIHQISPGTIFCSFFFWFSHPCQSTRVMRLGCLLWSVPGVCVDLLAITDCWNLCGRVQRLRSHLSCYPPFTLSEAKLPESHSHKCHQEGNPSAFPFYYIQMECKQAVLIVQAFLITSSLPIIRLIKCFPIKEKMEPLTA